MAGAFSRSLCARIARAGAGAPWWANARPIEEQRARAQRVAAAILAEISQKHSGSRHNSFNFLTALRFFGQQGMEQTDAVDIVHGVCKLLWEGLIEPTEIGGQLGWRRTRAPVIDADADELGRLRVAQRKFLFARGWQRRSIKNLKPTDPRNVRVQFMVTDERWLHPERSPLALSIDQAVMIQATLDEMDLQPAPEEAETDAALADLERVGEEIGQPRRRA